VSPTPNWSQQGQARLKAARAMFSVPASTLLRLWTVSRQPAALIGTPPRSVYITRSCDDSVTVCCSSPELGTNWRSAFVGCSPSRLNEPVRGNDIVSRVQAHCACGLTECYVRGT